MKPRASMRRALKYYARQRLIVWPFMICFLVLFLISNLFSPRAHGFDVPSIETDRSLILVPAASFFVPGFGQALDGNYVKSGLLFSYAAAGVLTLTEAQRRIDEFYAGESMRFHYYRDMRAVESIGSSMLGHAGMLSTFDSFTNHVKNYRDEGKYLFLPKEQTLETLLKAPFQFSYMTRWTTWLPFTLAIAMGVSEFSKSPNPDQFSLRPIDFAASSYTSYTAGTGEEAFFRGWAYPILYENSQSLWFANSVQALAFGFAHGPQPYFQIAAGAYFGWLTQRNNWDLSESIFVHAWWDFWVITASYARNRSFTRDVDLRLPILAGTF